MPSDDAAPVDRPVTARHLYGAIEGGGTKIVCVVGYSPDEVLQGITIPTRAPAPTLSAASDFFMATQAKYGALTALGVAFFGPLELNPDRPAYGRLLDTPKPGWSGVDLIGALRSRLPIPMAIDTDVAAAACAEWRLGAGRGAASVAYVTVGTGIGIGFAPDVLSSARLLHPEAGHLPMRRARGDERFAGVCPYHGDCLEGLASGPAIRARWGQELSALETDHPAWAVLGQYLGQLAASITLMVPVERIIFGGGVMASGALLPHVRASAHACLNGYIGMLKDRSAFEHYLCAPSMGTATGVAGALLLAQSAESAHRPII